LIQSLFAFIVTTAETGAAMTADRQSISSMKIMHGAFFLPCSNKVADARGADADEHLDESQNPKSKRTARWLHRQWRAPAESCPFPAVPSSARLWECGPPSF
jgi:hypothetical protein